MEENNTLSKAKEKKTSITVNDKKKKKAKGGFGCFSCC